MISALMTITTTMMMMKIRRIEVDPKVMFKMASMI